MFWTVQSLSGCASRRNSRWGVPRRRRAVVRRYSGAFTWLLIVLFVGQRSVRSIASLAGCRVTLVSESFPRNSSIFRFAPPMMLPKIAAIDHDEQERTCAHDLSQTRSGLESALLVTARTRKLLDSSLMIYCSRRRCLTSCLTLILTCDCRFRIKSFEYPAASHSPHVTISIICFLVLHVVSLNISDRCYPDAEVIDVLVMCRLVQPCHDS